MFEKERGKDGDDLYRLLWGYNKDQLQSGEAPLLVDGLENDSLDFRVLSLHTTCRKSSEKRSITVPRQRQRIGRQPVQRRWRDQLKDGLIVPKGSAPSKTQATAAKVPDAPTATDAARGLEPPTVPVPKTAPPPIPGRPSSVREASSAAAAWGKN